ncbi:MULTISPECIES: hypothetical protein [Paenibacillus]|uniref:hypothetical protein n=1 Tax=Paenibacillus TaxID=44249 RepID=UPI0030D94AC7
MMTLLKYDFRKNLNRLLASLVVLAAIQVAMALFFPAQQEILAVFSYVGVGVAIFIKVIRTYLSNLRSYSRRLVPVHGLSHVLSPLLFGTICGLVLLGLAAIHFYIYKAAHGTPGLGYFIEMMGFGPSKVAAIILFAWWVAMFMAITIFLSISIAGAFRWKTGPWIGILAFFVLTNVVSWLDNIIFSGRINPMDVFVVTESSSEISIVSTNFGWDSMVWGHIVFEVALAAIFVGVTVYLNHRRVEA